MQSSVTPTHRTDPCKPEISRPLKGALAYLPHSSMATDNPAFAGGDIEAGLKDGTLTAEQAVVLQETQLRAEMDEKMARLSRLRLRLQQPLGRRGGAARSARGVARQPPAASGATIWPLYASKSCTTTLLFQRHNSRSLAETAPDALT